MLPPSPDKDGEDGSIRKTVKMDSVLRMAIGVAEPEEAVGPSRATTLKGVVRGPCARVHARPEGADAAADMYNLCSPNEQQPRVRTRRVEHDEGKGRRSRRASR